MPYLCKEQFKLAIGKFNFSSFYLYILGIWVHASEKVSPMNKINVYKEHFQLRLQVAIDLFSQREGA